MYSRALGPKFYLDCKLSLFSKSLVSGHGPTANEGRGCIYKHFTHSRQKLSYLSVDPKSNVIEGKQPRYSFILCLFSSTNRTPTGTEKSFHFHSSKELGMDSGGPLFP